MSLLLHVCCAPCLIYPEQALNRDGISFSGYFFNPNIHPYKEFKKRLDTVVSYTGQHNIPLIVDKDYGLQSFLRSVVFSENKRCPICYQLRMGKTAELAQQKGFSSFTTTLLYSKYQNHGRIKVIGESLAAVNKVSFHYEDFRLGWQEGVDLSTTLGLYRQPYCGCIYSEQERYDNRLKKKMRKEKKRDV